MSTLKGACIIGQSGGPTAVINASVYGAVKTALESSDITSVLGAAHGIKGVLDDVLYDMGKEDPEELRLLLNTPSSALGSCRYKLKDPDEDESEYVRILEVFKKYNVRYFFYNGGNDSMDTCSKISRFMAKKGYECRVMGIPKTIDNDLANTDHCPGFGSAAKYIATSLMEIYKDSVVYDIGTITVVETMGRHAGWLAGSAGLASWFGCGPDLIYLPERVFDIDKFLSNVKELYDKNGKVLVVASEGIKDAEGVFISEYGSKGKGYVDSFGHTQLGGLAAILANIIKEKTGAKVRGIELSLLQRCAAHIASQTDINEAFLAGETAVTAALSGQTGKMVAFERETINGEYKCKTKLIPLEDVANIEKKVPLDWINPEGNGVTNEFIDYVLPLIQGEPDRRLENSLPRFAKLKKIKV
ncbi:MAG: 6-phosphofructokinase [Clostridiales bacterium]|jgi:6-phosphofructokinase|nr:6-phosphofructokinase [Clostridiales bacterium]